MYRRAVHMRIFRLRLTEGDGGRAIMVIGPKISSAPLDTGRNAAIRGFTTAYRDLGWENIYKNIINQFFVYYLLVALVWYLEINGPRGKSS